MEKMTADNAPAQPVALSERERAALRALAQFTGPVYGGNLALLMRANGRENTSTAAAHQAANALANKGLAVKRYDIGAGRRVRYQTTAAGRELAAPQVDPLADCCKHCEHHADEPVDPRTGKYRHDGGCPHGCNPGQPPAVTG
jgi:DNA-binding MarR family transcriptional regulator